MTAWATKTQVADQPATFTMQARVATQVPRLDTESISSELPAALADLITPAEPQLTAMRNGRMMRVLDRIAVKFEEAGVPLMALKGAVLNMTVYDRADRRPMDDLDLLVRERDADRAFAILEEVEGLRGASLVREDFFPQFHYEVDYTIGRIYPVRVDLHVRPFRPLRYSRVVPCDALWAFARRMRIGKGTILIPSDEEMLIHLATHAAIHACARRTWMTDLRLWVEQRGDQIDWTRFVDTAADWRLAWPVHQALLCAQRDLGPFLPADVLPALAQKKVTWRDRLCLRQAPQDAKRPAMHVLVNALTTPGLTFVLGYPRRVLIPDRAHMADWYCGRHAAWLPCAYLLRWLRPITSRIPVKWKWFTKIETRESRVHGIGVFATRRLKPGEVIARYHGREVDREGMYVVPHKTRDGRERYVELTGKLKLLNHSCRANARIEDFRLVATRPVMPDQEITICYAQAACECNKC